MKTLLIDNYDSFTFNIYQYIAEVNRVTPMVVRNNAATWEQLCKLEFDNIVISPGPGRPERSEDFGVCADAILKANVPILGVCLGHQGIAYLFGGQVDYAATVMHGRPSAIHHDQGGVFKDIPSPFSAIRYHSLYVRDLSDQLEKTAWTDDGMIMGIRHRSKPIWGVQFHPESIRTEYGHQIFQNFRDLTAEHIRRAGLVYAPSRPTRDNPYEVAPASRRGVSQARLDQGTLRGLPVRIHHRRLAMSLDAESVFLQNFADSVPAFWLDSALVRGFSRFSYMGDASGPHAEYITASIAKKEVRVHYRGEVEVISGQVFEYLERVLHERRIQVDGLPFDFHAGYAGYLGYELKAESDGDAAHESAVPDAAFVFADRLIAFDHEQSIVYLVCLDDEEHDERAKQWLDTMTERLRNVPKPPPWSRTLRPRPVKQTFRHPPEKYLELIQECQNLIAQGETYEVCLTNMITNHVKIDPLNTYRALRESNPAPYATYLRFKEVSVLSSSPERFITIDPYGVVESKPIKGTRKRGQTREEDEALYEDLRTNEKDRSENLMIVDLLRNDIGTLAEVGSVHVRNIFAVESYATVHQLVSTVCGRLRRGVSAIECIRKAFPGGSMTGAPKKRTMEIIDRLEAGPRGVYSGSIGFLGLNGSADLSIAIRTIVQTEDDITVGVGGAIIALSSPQAELDEMILKSKALVKVLSETNLDTSEASN